MKVLLVYANPLASSLNGKIKSVVEESLVSSGHEIDVIDLYADRFDPVLNQMREKFLRSNLKPSVVDFRLSWPRDESYYRYGNGWRLKNSPVILNQAIHWLDVFGWFFGDVKKVQSQSKRTQDYLECDDYASAKIEFKNNVIVNMIATTNKENSKYLNFDILTDGEKLSYEKLANPSAWHKRINSLLGKKSPP